VEIEFVSSNCTLVFIAFLLGGICKGDDDVYLKRGEMI
jgi:hypothetical protein